MIPTRPGDYGDAMTLDSSAAVQADGKIVIAGYSSNGTDYDIVLVRYWP